jgi:hypothetical protein
LTTAFQDNAFQAVILAFQIDAAAPVTPTDDTARSKGGWDPHRFYRVGKRRTTEHEVEEFIAEIFGKPVYGAPEPVLVKAEAAKIAAMEWQAGQADLAYTLAQINAFYGALRLIEREESDDEDFLLLMS